MIATLKKLIPENPENSKLDFQVTTCFIEYNEKILVLQRGRQDSQYRLWGIPGGKLENEENPREALSREIFEEIGIIIPPNSFLFLDKALIRNNCDGLYALYLYYFKLKNKPTILIDSEEHLASSWVFLEEFEKMDLLVSQGPAYFFVKEKLQKTIKDQADETR